MFIPQQQTLLFLDSIGTGEVLLIVFVIIVFFGSKKIPEMARVLGKGMREFKAAADNIQDEIQKSVTEIERSVNIENALKEETPRLVKDEPEKKEESEVKTGGPQLIKADTPSPAPDASAHKA
jgi:sec-independent protein translocase protein TatA